VSDAPDAERQGTSGPSWRRPEPVSAEDRRAIVLCRCGVEMDFLWPATSDAVRCFGCGVRFDRPEHFGRARPAPVWQPEAARRRRLRLTRQHLLVFALCLVAAILLGVGIGLALAGE